MADESFTIGARARCTDGPCGRVTQLVLDPVDDRVTHLVVEPDHREGLGRLVPLEWAESGSDSVQLSCTQADFEQLQSAEEIRFLPGIEGYMGYGEEDTMLWPYYGGNTTAPVSVDTLPPGEVAVQKGEQVHATDGHVGEVEGLVMDVDTHRVSHFVLKEGHLFGHRDVAIPLASVRAVDEDGIRLSISKGEVDDLPHVGFRRPGR